MRFSSDEECLILASGGGHVGSLGPEIRAEAKRAHELGWRVLAAEEGFKGVLANKYIEITPSNIDKLTSSEFPLIIGGSPRVKLGDSDREAIANRLSGANVYLTVRGGDDHLGEALRLSQNGVPTVGIARTMDGNLPVDVATYGFHSFVEAGVSEHHGARHQAYVNGSVVVQSMFARNTDHAPAAIAAWGGADVFLGGERHAQTKEGYIVSIDQVAEEVTMAIGHNRDFYGKDFATVVVSEGTAIEGFDVWVGALKEGTADSQVPFTISYDAHDHPKAQPELVGMYLVQLIAKHVEMKAQQITHTYEGRNALSDFDRDQGRLAGIEAVNALVEGDYGKAIVIAPDSNGEYGPARMDLAAVAREETLTDFALRNEVDTPVDYAKLSVDPVAMRALYEGIFGEPKDVIPFRASDITRVSF